MPSAYEYIKHREEVENYAHDFSTDLTDGETLSTVTDLRIEEDSSPGADDWSDVSSEFGSPSGSIDGDTVEWTLSAAGAGDQDEGTYRVVVAVTTSEGRTLVGMVDVPGPYLEPPRLRVVD